MTDETEKKFNRERQEINSRLDGLLGELGKTIGDVLNRLEDASGEVHRSQSFDTGNGPLRAEAGIRIRLAGQDVSSRASTMPDPSPVNRPEPAAPAVRTISATILQEAGFWSLTAEVPGMSQDDLSLSVENGQLHIRSSGSGRSYSGSFDIPAALSVEDLRTSLQNGILDLSATLEEGA